MRRLSLFLVLALLLPVPALAEKTEWRKTFTWPDGTYPAIFRVVDRQAQTFWTSFGSTRCVARIAPGPGGDGDRVEWSCSDGGRYLTSRKPGTRRFTVYDVRAGKTRFAGDDTFMAWAHDLAVQAVP